MTAPLKILYLVHDLSDAAVRRRVMMLRDGGAAVTLAGFRRAAEPVASIEGCPTINLGQTHNGAFLQRILSILRIVASLGKYRVLFAATDVVIARNLEMLAIGVRGRSLCSPPPVLVYESLDIHRLLLNQGPAGKILRGLEGWLSRRASLLLTSSPAFIREYFTPLSHVRLPTHLVENKVYAPDMADVVPPPARAPGPPWRIGWFGAIRCRKSLGILAEFARANEGRIEVIIRGKPALDEIPHFHAVVSATPHLTFAGPYRNPDDLAAIYGDVHFTWAIDMFEEGLNSSWLLPNRLYEGGLFGAVPLARASVETGRFLKCVGIGVLLNDPLPDALKDFFKTLTTKDYQNLAKSAMETPVSYWLSRKDDCVTLVRQLSASKD